MAEHHGQSATAPAATGSIRLAQTGGVATVTLDRAARHNSFVPEFLERLAEVFTQLQDEPDIDVVVLRAAGRSYSTGGDLAALQAAGRNRAAYADRLVGALNAAIVAIAESRQPVIAVVDGAVTGGALGLVIACDLVLVTDHAWFAPYYARVGLSPDGGWTALLPALIGPSRARAALLLEHRIDATTAVDWGLAQARVERTELEDTLAHWCERLRANDAASLAAARDLLRDPGYRAALERERRRFVATVTTPAAIEGVARFVAGVRDS